MKNLEVIDDVLLVKVGTSTLISQESIEAGEIEQKPFNIIGEQLKRQRENGKKIIIVSSAAIAAGMITTGIKIRPSSSKKSQLPELQRLSAIGWRTITKAWNRALSPIQTPDILITGREFGHTIEKTELLKVTRLCLEKNDIIISNENDTISTEEIIFGDNDKLAATYAKALSESNMFGLNIKLVLLSDIDGIYKNPKDASTLIPVVNNINDCLTFAADTSSDNGSGGMISKLDAYQIAKNAGVDMWIANGSNPNAIEMALNGETGTYFPAAA